MAHLNTELPLMILQKMQLADAIITDSEIYSGEQLWFSSA